MLLALALSGLGAHPAATLGFDPLRLARPEHWTATVAALDRAGITMATIADGPPDPDPGPDGAPRTPWLDAMVIASRVAPDTARIGIVAQIPTVTTDPFLVATQVATLDHVSGGRAGWEPYVSLDPHAGDLVGPRAVPPAPERYAEAAEHVEVVRQLWDSWDDDAEIRDRTAHRFIDRDRLHHIDYAGRYLQVAGPSITPRPPQGQPIVALATGGDPASRTLAAQQADVVFVRAAPDRLARAVVAVSDAAGAAGRRREDLRILAELRVVLHHDAGYARDRAAELDANTPHGWFPTGSRSATSDSAFAGSPGQLAARLHELPALGADGVRLHPAVLAVDLPPVLTELAPAVRGATPAGGTLRDRLGMPRPAGRFALAR